MTMKLLVLIGVLACGAPLPHEWRAAEKQAQERLHDLERHGLDIGQYPLAANAVVDGDTIKVRGLDASLRLLAVDAEETFKKDKERRAFEAGWAEYLRSSRGSSPHPVKMATPVGEDGKRFAQEFFAGVTTVRLERDHPKEIRDYYDRYLAYLFAEKDGRWVNYNVELVRAGLSPYFTKYGVSRRFHRQFLAAEKEARAAGRGIWDPQKMHYPDYDERRRWWDARGEFVQAFEREAQGKESWIVLTNSDAVERLEKHVGKQVTLLGAVGAVRLGDHGPSKVMLSRRRGADFPLIFFDKDVLAASGVEKHGGEYVRVMGFVSRYTDAARKRYQLQIIVDLPSQVSTSPTESQGPEADEEVEP